MKAKITKWGNSYGIRIPAKIMTELHLTEDSALYISAKENKIILQKPSREEILDKLLENAQPQKEIDWGEKRGNEFW